MKLQIKGNLVELHRTIEEFTKNKEVELKKRTHSSTVKSAVLSGISLLLLTTGIILHLIPHNSPEAVIIFLVFATFVFFVAFLYTILTVDNKIDVDAETKQAVRDMYGNREHLLDSYHLGRILSVEANSILVNPGRIEIQLLFWCQNDSKEVEAYTLRTHLSRTSDIDCKGALILDLEHGTGTCYYKDVSALNELSKNNVEFEITNQFQPRV